MTTKDYKMAFLELAAFRREYLGDAVWINDYIATCIAGGREVVVIPKGGLLHGQTDKRWSP